MNTSIVVFFTVIISLTFGTLGGYALARSGFRYAFLDPDGRACFPRHAAYHARLGLHAAVL